MPVIFHFDEPVVVVDTGRLLPEDAYLKIGHELNNGDVSKEVLLTHARIMYSKLCEAEAKLMQTNRKLGIYRKQFNCWVEQMRKMRADAGMNITHSKEVASERV